MPRIYFSFPLDMKLSEIVLSTFWVSCDKTDQVVEEVNNTRGKRTVAILRIIATTRVYPELKKVNYICIHFDHYDSPNMSVCYPC